MKKLFALIVLVAGIALSSTAQSFTLMPLKAGDTLVLSASSDTVTKVITATAGYSAAAFKVKLTELSGTTACKAYLYGGDGTDYNITDSVAFTDQTTNIAWITKVTTPYSHYKIQVRPMGDATATFSGIVRVSYVYKKHD
jgi:hypothetical protein